MMAQHTLVVVTDMDLFRLDEGQRGADQSAGDFPEYCTLVFVYDVLPYKRDGKMKKLCAAIGGPCAGGGVLPAGAGPAAAVDEAAVRGGGPRHRHDATADHLLFTCGTLMTDLVPEIREDRRLCQGPGASPWQISTPWRTPFWTPRCLT